MRLSSVWVISAGLCLAACAADSVDSSEDEPSASCAVEPGCDAFTLTVIYQPSTSRRPVDLAFNPSVPFHLWVLNNGDDSVEILQRPGGPNASVRRLRDPAASHFMHRPTGLAFGAVVPRWGQTFGVCGDNDNSHWGTPGFMGPALFSADLSVFAQPTPGGLGSHLDMLHSTSFCRGIAHLRDNRYFVFNADKGSLDEYDFHRDHGPGMDDHADGEIYRWVQGQVQGLSGVPSHLAYSRDENVLYVADTGHRRVVALDLSTGTLGAPFPGLEKIAARRYVDGAVLTDVVPPGVLQAPSGIELHGGLLHVTDHMTSRIHVFERDGTPVRVIDTGLPGGSLAGLAIGPHDGKIYFTDRISGRVYRVDPRQ